MSNPPATIDDMQSMHPAQTPQQMVDRIRALAPEANDNVKRQHVISRVILKNFTAKPPHRHAGRLGVVDLERPHVKPTFHGPKGVGYVDNYVRYASRSLEALWSVTENRLPEAIKACRDQTIFANRGLVRIAKNALVMHYLRSVHTRQVHDLLWRQHVMAVKAFFLQRPEALVRAFRERYLGLVPLGLQGLEALLDESMKPTIVLRKADALSRESHERLYRKGCEFVDSMGLEVCTPASGEFILGDAPAIAVSEDGRMGLPGGVALGDAVYLALAVAPDLVIALGPKDAYGTVGPDRVEELNIRQVRIARQYVYFRPESKLDQHIRKYAAQV